MGQAESQTLVVVEVVEDSEPLAAGWVECTDRDNKLPYWYKTDSEGETEYRFRGYERPTEERLTREKEEQEKNERLGQEERAANDVDLYELYRVKDVVVPPPEGPPPMNRLAGDIQNENSKKFDPAVGRETMKPVHHENENSYDSNEFRSHGHETMKPHRLTEQVLEQEASHSSQVAETQEELLKRVRLQRKLSNEKWSKIAAKSDVKRKLGTKNMQELRLKEGRKKKEITKPFENACLYRRLNLVLVAAWLTPTARLQPARSPEPSCSSASSGTPSTGASSPRGSPSPKSPPWRSPELPPDLTSD